MKYTITQSRLLYAYSLDDRIHDGLIKVGDVLVDNEIVDSGDKSLMEDAVKEILSQRAYMKDIDLNSLLFKFSLVEPTTYNNATKCYDAGDVHRTLLKMGVPSKALNKINKEDADIWFACTIDKVQDAITAIKNGRGAKHGAIRFRPEQEKAISETVKHFQTKTGKHYLWNAKMRFGKTLSGLEVAKRLGDSENRGNEGRLVKSTLIITHRPVVDASWAEDFDKIFSENSGYYYATRMDKDEENDRVPRQNHIQNITLDKYRQLIKDVDASTKRLVMFVSMQYLRLSKYVGGKERNEDPLKKEIMMYDWDYVMIDEAHEGIEAAAGVRVIEKLKKDKTRILSLSGTPFNLLDKYEEGEIYTWDYVMEQKAKQEWDDQHFGDPNPYADLPRMQILTFTLPKMLRDEAIENNEVFKFHEFFRVWTDDDKPLLEKAIENESNSVKKAELQEKLKTIRPGRFVYESAVSRFLDKLVEESDTSQYPFATDEFRDNFRHTFWLLPGVKEAKALEDLLVKHDVFGEENGMFKIVNVAGDGNIEDIGGKALKAVQDAIKQYDRTITLSCGKLTTGVSVPEWTAVLCMKGSENTPAANYMQTIFRVQTHAVLQGRQKSDCYVFDFAPDRALTAVAETAKMAVIAAGGKDSKRLKKTQKEEEDHLAAFIKLCPVLSMDEGEMGKHFSATQIFEKLSNVYIERAVRSGYADNSLYDAEKLLNLTPEQEAALGDVHDLLGSMPSGWKPEKITINDQGLGKGEGDEDVQVLYCLTSEKQDNLDKPVCSEKTFPNGAPMPDDDIWSETMSPVGPMFRYLYACKAVKREGAWSDYSKPILYREYFEPKETDENQKERDRRNKEKRARMSVLRGVSIRIPLLVYGAEINDDNGEEITIDNFTSLVDDPSWEEYMPTGFKKETFDLLRECFDRAIFTGAAKRIRSMVKEADTLNTEDRIAKIATIFSYFHNPDKETVLTPWKVVNRHMSDTVGGWCFYNELFDENYTVENKYGEYENSARLVDRGDVTRNIFGNYNSRILEVNSKTGLYPLYMAYSMFRTIKVKPWKELLDTGERGTSTDAASYNRQAINDWMIWEDVLQDNIFVVCRTSMAASITRRTLAGFRKGVKMNVICYKKDVRVNDLIDAGVLKRDTPGVSKVGDAYYYYDEETKTASTTKRCDMIDVLRAKPELFERDVVKGKDFWNVYNSIPKSLNENINDMKFTAIVGNPPYQLMGASGGNNDAPIYQHFFDAAKNITGRYVSLIIPSRWFAAGRDNLLGGFRKYMLTEGTLKTMTAFIDSRDVFPTVDIKGGVCYFLVDVGYNGTCHYSLINKGKVEEHDLELGNFKIMIRSPKLAPIVKHVIDKAGKLGLGNMSSVISNDTPFGIPSNPHSSKKNPYNVSPICSEEYNLPLYIKNKVREVEYVRRADIHKNEHDINRVKVFMPGAAGTGQDTMILGKPWLASAPSVCTQTFIYAAFDSESEAKNFISYYKTKFFRALVSAVKITQSAANDVYQFVPAVSFNEPWTDEKLFKMFDIKQPEQDYINSIIADWNDQVDITADEE